MSLITEIQQRLTDPQSSLSAILREVQVLAMKLKSTELEDWVKNELNGYSGKPNVPEYRIFHAQNYGELISPFNRVSNLPIAIMTLPQELQEYAKSIVMNESINTLTENLKRAQTAGTDHLNIPWIPDAIKLASITYNKEGWQLVSVWKLLPVSIYDEILERVRNKLLTFILELQKMHPNIENSDDELKNLEKGSIENATKIIITGNNANVIVGNGNIQAIATDVQKNDLESLMIALKVIGLEERATLELKEALQKDYENNQNKYTLGQKVNEWLGKINQTIPFAELAFKIPQIIEKLKAFIGL